MGEKGQPTAAAVAGQNVGSLVNPGAIGQTAGVSSGQSSATAGQTTSTTGGEKGQTAGLSDLSQELAQIGLT